MRPHEETLEREAKDDFSLIVHQARPCKYMLVEGFLLSVIVLCSSIEVISIPQHLE